MDNGTANRDDRETEAWQGVLARGRWFGGLPAPLQRTILQRSSVRRYGRAEYLVREGDPPKALMAVLSGRVRVVRTVGEGHEALMAVVGAGIWLTEYSVLAGEPSLSSMVADSAVQALVLPVSAFEGIVDADPRAFRLFAGLLTERYALLYRYAAEARGLPAEAWLLTRLTDLAAMQRAASGSIGPVTLHLSQSDLASMVGMSRQSLNALLARLRARGLVEVGFRAIRVLGQP